MMRGKGGAKGGFRGGMPNIPPHLMGMMGRGGGFRHR